MNEGASGERPTSIVILGASGDLTKRKLMPALFSLWRKGRLPERFRIVGFSRTEWSDDEYRAAMRDGLEEFASFPYGDDEWVAFAARLSYLSGDLSDLDSCECFAEELAALEGQSCNRLYYLATPPQLIAEIVTHIGQKGLLDEEEGSRRVVVEKPFGWDLDSARRLNRLIHRQLDDSQIYRIDHYLVK